MTIPGMKIAGGGTRTSFLIFVLAACASLSAQTSALKKLPLVAVMPLTGQGLDEASSQVVTDALADELMKTGRVRVMERSQMETILKEQGFAQSGACDGSECAVQMGKLLSIDKMIVGSLGKLGSAYSISVRAVDVSSGEVVGTSRKMQRGDIDEVVTQLLPSVAKEISMSLNGFRLLADEPVVIKPVAVVVPKVVAPAPVVLPPVSAPKPTPSSADSTGGSHWGWWVAGGAAVASGAAAAVLFSGKKSTSSSAAPTASSDNGSWQTTVGW